MHPKELEQHIADLGRLMVKAYADGQFKEAREFLRLQTEAIKSRPAFSVKLMEIERGLV
jgi:hypothetical protein